MRYPAVVAVGIALVSLTACDDSPLIADPTQSLFQVEVAPDSVFIPVGDSVRLEAQITGPPLIGRPEVEWRLADFSGFEDPEVTSDGRLRGIAAGAGHVVAQVARSESQVLGDGGADTVWIAVAPLVTPLRTVPEGSEATFGDLNESGQALWHEDGQAILWDNGEIRELPLTGMFLGSSGEVLGSVNDTAALWWDGELTMLAGSPRGLLDDGTVYVLRNDTMLTWRDGTLTTTDRPAGIVGPQGRIWTTRPAPDFDPVEEGDECGYYRNGDWHGILRHYNCRIDKVEGNGWAVVNVYGHDVPGDVVVGPTRYSVWEGGSFRLDIAQINAHGTALTHNGIVATPPGDQRTDLTAVLETALRPGAVNDDREILAQLGNEVVLLSLR